MWVRKFGRRVRIHLDANDDGGSGGNEGGDNDTGDSDKTPADDSGKKDEGGDKTPESIPYKRFKEVNDDNKALKAKLAEYEKKETEEAEKKKKADEEEAKKKGEFEKLLTLKDQEIADYKKQQETWKEREETVKSRNAERVETLKKDLGDGWNDYENLVSDINDPFKLSQKLDSIEKIAGSKKSSGSSGGSNMPSGGKNDGRLAELQEKARKGEHLTNLEQQEYLKLAREKRSEEKK